MNVNWFRMHARIELMLNVVFLPPHLRPFQMEPDENAAVLLRI